jgi:DNA-binding NarL/FixJ family response regulator
MIMSQSDVHYPWNIYANLQQLSSAHDRLSDTSWGIERALNTILELADRGEISADPGVLTEQVENAINSGSWNERDRVRIRGRHFESLTEHVVPSAEAVVLLGELGGDLADEEWAIITAIADGVTYEELSREMGVSVRSLRTRVCRLRSRMRGAARYRLN